MAELRYIRATTSMNTRRLPPRHHSVYVCALCGALTPDTTVHEQFAIEHYSWCPFVQEGLTAPVQIAYTEAERRSHVSRMEHRPISREP